MPWKDTIKNLIGMPTDEDYNDNEEYNNEDEYVESPAMTVLNNQKNRDRVLNVNTTAQLAVVLVKPENFEDASAIADHLNDKKTVVLNLESANKDVSRRMIDFLCGAAYANHGKMKRVANNTYIITPYNVDIMGDLLDELENNGVIF